MTETPEQLVKSKKRVVDHGEVFTPEWLVKDMLDLVRDECERIEAHKYLRFIGGFDTALPIEEM